ncbi:probable cyclic nucleotide-gated ion channel 20, chloroplastic [Daucus carota subsp. sativus]
MNGLNESALAIAIPASSQPSENQTFPNNIQPKRLHALLRIIFLRVMNPYSRCGQIWRKFVISFFIFAFLLQTLEPFLQYMKQDTNCIAEIDNSFVDIVQILVDLSNFIFILHVIIKFKTAYVDPESRLLVYDPIKVVYYRGVDLCIDFLFILPDSRELVQDILSEIELSAEAIGVFSFFMYLAVLWRLSVFAEPSVGAFFESWSSKFVVNLVAFLLFSHVVGMFWYFFASLRVEQCLEEACGEPWCSDYISCEPADYNPDFIFNLTLLSKWKNNKNAMACFGPDGYNYGIYVQAVGLMKNSTMPMRYIYSLSWGFQQISTLDGNQTPSVFVVEVLFSTFITAMGALLFSFLIGNIQRFLQAQGSRSFENSLRGSDIEQWMSHRQLPDDLKSKIRDSERYNWLATRGLNELMLLENLPEDLQRDIRRHLFKFDKKLPIVASMDESILDAIRERMKHNTYIEGSRVLVRGGLMDKMVYIVQGKLESTSEGETVVPLSEGDVCGAELITLCLEHYVLNRDGDKFTIPAGKLVSKRTVRCLTNVEAFTLRAADLEDVFSLYSGLLIQNPLVQGAITKESLYPKSLLRSRSY